MTFTTVPRDILNPADGSVITTVVDNSAGDVDAAVRRAHVAQRTWALASPGYRASALREFARAVTAHRDELAALETSKALRRPALVGDRYGAGDQQLSACRKGVGRRKVVYV